MPFISFHFQRHVPVVMLDYKEEQIYLKGVLKFVTTENGDQYVVTLGIIQMLQLCATSWDIQQLVGTKYLLEKLILCFS